MGWLALGLFVTLGGLVVGVPTVVLFRRAKKLDREGAEEWEPDPDPPFDYRDWVDRDPLDPKDGS